MEKERRLNCTPEQMESLIEMIMWFWGNLHQRWRFAVENEYGLDETLKIELDFIGEIGKSHAVGLKKIFDIGKGITGLKEAFRFLPENFVEPFNVVEQSPKHIVFRNPSCTAQKARLKRNKREYPCKEPAIIYFTKFASEVDPQIKTTCIICPPDKGNNCTCQWRFEVF